MDLKKKNDDNKTNKNIVQLFLEGFIWLILICVFVYCLFVSYFRQIQCKIPVDAMLTTYEEYEDADGDTLLSAYVSYEHEGVTYAKRVNYSISALAKVKVGGSCTVYIDKHNKYVAGEPFSVMNLLWMLIFIGVLWLLKKLFPQLELTFGNDLDD